MSDDRRLHQTIDRLSRIPTIRREVWQGGLVLLPVWVDRPGAATFRPHAAFWVSTTNGRLTVDLETAPDSHGPELLLTALLRFAKQEVKLLGGRARRLQVADEAQRDALAAWLGEADTEVELVPHLEAFDASVTEYLAMVRRDEERVESLLSGRDVTLEVVRALADASARFSAAAPWRHLTDEDLIELKHTDAPAGYRFAVVLGNAGQTFGLGFYDSRDQHEELLAAPSPHALPNRVHRSLLLEPAHEIPTDDHDLWLQHDLPLAGPAAYPFPAHYYPDGRLERPSRRELEFAISLLLALAETSEEEMDSGRWSKRVTVGGVERTVRLSLPGLLEEAAPTERGGIESGRRAMERVQADVNRFLEEGRFESMDQANAALQDFMQRRAQEGPRQPATREEEAQWLADEALEWFGRKRVQLAKRALSLWPDCADAYSVLAESRATPLEAVALYEQAVEAGRRAVGPEFEEWSGRLWGYLPARPFVRAKLSLAMALEDAGRDEEAVTHLQDLLRLNEGDNQGVRDLLVPRLLERGRHEEAEAVLARYPEDPGATLAYCRALWAFQREGDSQAARDALAAAWRSNRHVPKALRDPMPPFVEHYRFGSEEEAAVSAESMGDAWRTTAGALDWLDAQVRALRVSSRGGAKKGKKKGR
jgi:tetratricopeptide (TPR) repeat protein